MNRVWPALWLLASCFLLWPAVDTLLPSHLAKIEWPQTPLDKVAPKQALQWKFARAARSAMSRGASYTVRSPDHHDTMSLYMITLGMMPDSEAQPSSYFGIPMAGGGDKAAFTLNFPCKADQPDFGCTQTGGGCICPQEPKP
jgi:hypothetical protein